jgi:hypothetical protein
LDNRGQIDSTICRDCPFTVSANISPNQDLAMATRAENITITFNEPLAEINLDQIRVEVLGFKGGEVPLGADIFPHVPIATRLSPDKTTLIIDLDPDHEPNTPLGPGLVFAVQGLRRSLEPMENPSMPRIPTMSCPQSRQPFPLPLPVFSVSRRMPKLHSWRFRLPLFRCPVPPKTPPHSLGLRR